MPYPHAGNLAHNHIRAAFRTSAVCFDLPPAVTFEILAERLCKIGERHDGPLTGIEVIAEPARGNGGAMMRHLIGMKDVPSRAHG